MSADAIDDCPVWLMVCLFGLGVDVIVYFGLCIVLGLM